MAVTSTHGFPTCAALRCPAPAFVPQIFCTCQISLASDQTIKKSVASIPAVSPGHTAAMPNISLPQQEELLAAFQACQGHKQQGSHMSNLVLCEACKCFKSLPNKQQAAGYLMQALAFQSQKCV